jgi:hypothetical protein
MIAADHRPTFTRLAGLVLLSLATASAGCGARGPTVALHPTTGRVLFQGKPLEGVLVTFRPLAAEPGMTLSASMGQTDADGKFHLVTAVGEEGRTLDGAPTGDYAIALAPAGKVDSADFLNKQFARTPPNPIGNRFANAQTTGLKATIKPGPNELEPFDLK